MFKARLDPKKIFMGWRIFGKEASIGKLVNSVFGQKGWGLGVKKLSNLNIALLSSGVGSMQMRERPFGLM